MNHDTSLAVQYLEPGPATAGITPQDAQAHLRAACERLPISDVLLGWDLPTELVHACAEETARAGARLYRWHPLLTGDGTFAPRPEWQTIGLDGEPVEGFRGLPGFTFVCPNRPAVRQAALNHLRQVCQSDLSQDVYQGVFLDRIRYPSPAADPPRLLACFCDDCRRTAEDERLDLPALRRQIAALLAAPERAALFLGVLLDPEAPAAADSGLAALRAFLNFRTRSVTRFVRAAAAVIRAEGLAVGLDCFSPALTSMVGQDLGALDACCDWIKIMSYGHAFGPAGLPFELLDLADWLMGQQMSDHVGEHVGERAALALLSRASRLPIPSTRATLQERGLPPDALAGEVKRARTLGVSTLLAGIELVELEGVTRLHPAQIEADLRAFRQAGADGLVLSWDLWRIPLERLDVVRQIWA